MGEKLHKQIDTLRKQSRLLLAQVNENSKKVKNEIKNLYLRNLTFGENSKNYGGETGQFHDNRKTNKSWKLRNDSSGVGGALRSDCFCNSPNQIASMPNTSTVKRVLISSKKRSDSQHCLNENVCRKPVKECYCNCEAKKVQLRSTRTQHKQYSPCKRCRSHATYPARVIEENTEKSALSSPISCETLRRVQKIDYAPRSQFLRNVRSRVSLLQTEAGTGDCPDTCFKSQCYHEFMARKNLQNTDSVHRLIADDKRLEISRLAKSVPTKSAASKEHSASESETVDKSSKGVQVSLKKHSKPKVVRRTISSKTSVPDLKKPKSKVAPKSRKTVPSKECQCGEKNKSGHSRPENYENYEEYQGSVCVNKPQKQSSGEEYLSDREVRELRKFREQNYFDTHGSSHTLVSSKSSGSLEQYLLNDRLFPEAARKVHKKDLVVTMPACATTQRKRIHYFPRYIVRQEKSNFNANYKKKRCQTCPLTGHAIDLGITKIRPPLNSLALKYQKRLP